MEKKDYSRSIRMTETVRIFVDSFEGNGFNEKFENLVLHCMKNKDDLDIQINDKNNQLRTLRNDIREKKEILNSLDNLSRIVTNIIKSNS